MTRFKFFSTTHMKRGHIHALRRSRRVLVNEKVVNYDGELFLEHVSYSEPIYVIPKDDYIISELSSIELGENGEYDYSLLSKRFRNYMRVKDDEFFNKEYNEWKNRKAIEMARQNRAIENAEFQLDRELFKDELDAILEGEKVVETPIYIKARKSNRRAYKTVLELIRANIDKFECFITLTFAEKEHEEKHKEFGADFKYADDPYNFEVVKKEFSNFIKTLSTNLRRNGYEFEYIAVYEQHKSGRYHFHLISTFIPNDEKYISECPEWLDTDYRTGERRNGLMLKHWEFGKSDIEIIRDKERMSTYLVKYLIKNFNSINSDDESYLEFLGQKKYFCSKGLKRPTVEYFSRHDEEKMKLLENKKAEYSDIYSTTYQNPYSDSEILRTICSKQL